MGLKHRSFWQFQLSLVVGRESGQYRRWCPKAHKDFKLAVHRFLQPQCMHRQLLSPFKSSIIVFVSNSVIMLV